LPKRGLNGPRRQTTEIEMLTPKQAEVIRYLHSKFYDAEPLGDEKVQIITTVVDKNGYLRRYRQVIAATLSAAQAVYC
jgi:hypothetical protein